MQNLQNMQAATNYTKQLKGETIRQLAHRHLLDPSHTTTDEELLNAQLEFSVVVEVDRESFVKTGSDDFSPAFLDKLNGSQVKDSRLFT